MADTQLRPPDPQRALYQGRRVMVPPQQYQQEPPPRDEPGCLRQCGDALACCGNLLGCVVNLIRFCDVCGLCGTNMPGINGFQF